MVLWWGCQGHCKESGQFPFCSLAWCRCLTACPLGWVVRKKTVLFGYDQRTSSSENHPVFPIGCYGEPLKTPYGACSVSYHPSQELSPFGQTYTRVLSGRIGRAGIEVLSHYEWGKLRLKRVGKEMTVYSLFTLLRTLVGASFLIPTTPFYVG